MFGYIMESWKILTCFTKNTVVILPSNRIRIDTVMKIMGIYIIWNIKWNCMIVTTWRALDILVTFCQFTRKLQYLVSGSNPRQEAPLAPMVNL